MVRRTHAFLVMAAVACSVVAAGGAGQLGFPGSRPGLPARDNAAQTSGSAVIRGRVLTADTGSPVRRAQVRATSAEARAGRLATTDAEGRFELRDLPAGRWTLTASKAGFVTLQYGQRRPLERGQALVVRDGEVLDRTDISLPRGAAITGRVFDEFGDAVAGARVQVLRYQIVQGSRRLVPVGGGDQTDDTGAFRVFGLAPGEYVVSASLRAAPLVAGTDGTTYAPTYFPGTGNPAEAQRIAVAVSQEQGNINFPLLPVRTVRVSGVVLSSSGGAMAGGVVALASADGAAALGVAGNTTRIRANGTFMLTNVVPGTYTLTAGSGPGRRGGSGDVEFASMPISVGNDDLTGLAVMTSLGATISGVVVKAEGSTGNLRLTGLQVVAQSLTPEPGPIGGARNASVGDDAIFTLSGLSGQRLIRLNGLPQDWMLTAVRLDATDVTDTPLELRGSEQVRGLQLVVTDRVTEVNGRVTSRGQAVREYSVVVFPEDERKWTFPSRFVRSSRGDQEGLFRIRSLPPGERYLAVAVDYLEDGEAFDPEFLTQVRDRAARLTLADGESKALDLPLVTR